MEMTISANDLKVKDAETFGLEYLWLIFVNMFRLMEKMTIF